MRISTQLFILSTIVQAGSSAFFAFWPLHVVGFPSTLSAIWHTYTLSDSNLDVAVSSYINIVLILSVLWLVGVSKPQRGSHFRVGGNIHKKAIIAIDAISITYQLVLLTKAVFVAILGAEHPYPCKHSSGLVYIYLAIVTGLLMSFIQAPTAKIMIGSYKKAHKRATRLLSSSDESLPDAEQPLLGPSRSKAAAAAAASEEEEEQELENEKASRATIGALLKLSTPDTPILLLAFSCGAAAALGQALIPYYTGKIIDLASIDPDPKAFKLTTLKLLAVALACAIFTGLRGGLFTVSMTRLNVRLRKALFASLMAQDTGFYDSTKTGEISSRLAADTTTVSDQISLNLNVMLRSAMQAAMVLVFMFSASWRLTVVTFVLVPIVLAICKVYGSYYRKLSKKVQSELAEANSVAEEALGTMTTIKAHAAEGSTQVAYAEKLGKFYILEKSVAAAYAAYISTNTFLSAAVVCGLLYYGGTLVLAKKMSAGALVSFMLYQQSLTGAFQQLGDVFSALSAAVGAAEKVIELMHRKPSIPPPGIQAPPAFTGRIELRNVCFSYPSRPQTLVLSNFSLTVEPGELVAFVGPSGGGKSSIVKLLERFYVPTTGSVLIDGRDVGDYQQGWLHRHIALVSQEPVLYHRTVKRNIIFGLEAEDGVPDNEIPTQEDIEDAAKLANAHDFITALPDGYETVIMGNTSLSGGQKQRLAIARALVRRPNVLLLDEATSALDSDSEHVVQEALDRTMAGRTVLVIAHRLSTIRHANRIVVVKGGEVVEIGTHDDLLRRDGVYAALVKRQMMRDSSEDGGGPPNLGRTSSYINMTS